MRRWISWVTAGLMIGAILRAAQWFSPELLPWVMGFMIGSLGLNIHRIRVLMGLEE